MQKVASRLTSSTGFAFSGSMGGVRILLSSAGFAMTNFRSLEEISLILTIGIWNAYTAKLAHYLIYTRSGKTLGTPIFTSRSGNLLKIVTK